MLLWKVTLEGFERSCRRMLTALATPQLLSTSSVIEWLGARLITALRCTVL
jgi:hypothetical protein